MHVGLLGQRALLEVSRHDLIPVGQALPLEGVAQEFGFCCGGLENEIGVLRLHVEAPMAGPL